MNVLHPPADEQTIITRERIRLLAWDYYLRGGVGAVFAKLAAEYCRRFRQDAVLRPTTPAVVELSER